METCRLEAQSVREELLATPEGDTKTDIDKYVDKNRSYEDSPPRKTNKLITCGVNC